MAEEADDPLWYDRDEGEKRQPVGVRLAAFVLIATSRLWSLPDRLYRRCLRVSRAEHAR